MRVTKLTQLLLHVRITHYYYTLKCAVTNRERKNTLLRLVTLLLHFGPTKHKIRVKIREFIKKVQVCLKQAAGSNLNNNIELKWIIFYCFFHFLWNFEHWDLLAQTEKRVLGLNNVIRKVSSCCEMCDNVRMMCWCVWCAEENVWIYW